MKIRIEEEKPDIIGLTELKPKHSHYVLQPPELELSEYDCFHQISGSGRGVVLYIKSSLQAVEVNIREGFDHKAVQDTKWCEIRLAGKDKMIVGVIYRSPNNTNPNNMLLAESLLKFTSMGHSHIIVMGDFNHPELDWIRDISLASNNHPATKFLEAIRDTFLFQNVTQPTHHRGLQKSNILDLIFSNEKDMIANLQYKTPIGKSHHSVLTFTAQCYYNAPMPSGKIYSYDKGDYLGLNDHISSQDWDAILCSDSVEENWEIFHKQILSMKDHYIPSKTNHHVPKGKKKPLWMNSRALSFVKAKGTAFKKYLETKDGMDYTSYCIARNKARRATRQAMKQFEKQIAKEAKLNPKAFHKFINSKIKVKSGISELEYDGKLAVSDEEKTEALNTFFTGVFTKEDLNNIPDIEPALVNNYLDQIFIKKEDITKKLKALNSSKSQGPDGIHPRLIKETAETIVTPLYIIFNQSITSGIVPSEWKKGNITPIFKKGSKKSVGNYRPVSLTSVCCKIMESLVRSQLLEHLTTNDLFCKNQHGFMQGRSCVTQLLSVMEAWTDILDRNLCLDTIYFDFQKAFDTVPHERLLRKIESYGIKSNPLNWIRSYLSDRSQRVIVNGASSSWTDVTSGVPQGSVLGPILFLIYINDMPNVVHSCIMLFADDTKLYRVVTSPEDCVAIQQDIDNLVEWSRLWQLRFHPKKCKVMRVGTGHPDARYHMTEGDGDVVELEITRLEKDLGVHIDDQLKFHEHVSKTVSKGNQLVGLIRRSFQFMDNDMFITLYKSRVRPILEYANTIWNPRCKKDIDAIENVQRRATKMLPKLNHLAYEERLSVLDLPSLVYRRARGDMIECYKYLNEYYSLESDWLKQADDSVTRGHSQKLVKRRCYTEVRRHCFSNRVVKPWNALPESVVTAGTLNSFKSRLDKFWSQNKFSSDTSIFN